MAVTLAAVWAVDGSQVMADPGAGAFRVNATTVEAITTGAFSATDATGADRRAMLTALTTGAVLTSHQLDFATAFVTYQVTGAAVDHGTWIAVPLTVTDATPDWQDAYLLPTQRIVFTQAVAGATWAVGDLAIVLQPYELVPANATVLVVAVGSYAVLLLFRDGTQGWFTEADQATYGVSRTGTAAAFAGYGYDTDLRVHEDWRAGLFDPVWLPHPPAGAFAVFAQGRGAPPQTAPFLDA